MTFIVRREGALNGVLAGLRPAVDRRSRPILGDITVRIVAGDVTVAAGPSPQVDVITGHRAPTSSSSYNDTALFVSQPDPDLAPIGRTGKLLTEGRRHRCRVMSPRRPARPSRHTVSADIVVSGFEGETKVKSVSGDSRSPISGTTCRREDRVRRHRGEIDRSRAEAEDRVRRHRRRRRRMPVRRRENRVRRRPARPRPRPERHVRRVDGVR